MTCRLIAFILLVVPFISCHKLITILSDFSNDKDVDFFKTTLPWIVDNVGYDINLKFHFKDSGRNSGPRQCVLLQLFRNTYLQAEFLKCLAKGGIHADCITNLPINIRQFNNCLKDKVKSFVRNAESEFRKFKPKTTPFIILPRRKIVSDINPKTIINSICALYFRNPPVGCLMPSPLPDKETPTPEEETKFGERTTPGTPHKPEDSKTTKKTPPKSEGGTTPEKPSEHDKATVPGETPKLDSGTTSKSSLKPGDGTIPDVPPKADSETTTQAPSKPGEDLTHGGPPKAHSGTTPEAPKKLDEGITPGAPEKPDSGTMPKSSPKPEEGTTPAVPLKANTEITPGTLQK